MPPNGEDIANVVLTQFARLPKKRKPLTRENSVKEWVPLAGIVGENADGELRCLALGTGMKCLPATKIPTSNGIVLHDWHAEIVALRAFNRFLLDECKALVKARDYASDWIERTAEEENGVDRDTSKETRRKERRPFKTRDGVKWHMYCSEAPCGDASMELTISLQSDATPWEAPPPVSTSPSHFENPAPPTTLSQLPITPSSPSTPSTITTPLTSQPALLGRGYFSSLGIVRRKPSRPDAPPTLSKSCSDKLASTQLLTLLSSLPSLFISPQNLHLTTITLPLSQFSESGCLRAFGEGGRMAALISRTTAASDANPSDSAHKEAGTGSGNGNDRMHGSDYEFRPFRLVTTTLEFPYSRRSAPSASLVPSNIAAAWTASGIEETVIGGVLQGRKVGDVRGASKLSRRRMWELARNLAQELATELASGLDVKATLQEKWGQELRETLDGACYGDIKSAVLLEERHVAKAVLRERALVGWVRNVGDEGWGLDRSST